MVVAPPEMVRPVVWPPAPIVELAYAVRPPLNWVRVEVELPVPANGYANVEAPNVDAEMQVPLYWRQPVAKLRPLAKDDVAVPLTRRLPAIVVEPVLSMLKSVVVAEAVDEPMAKRVVAVSPLLVWMPNLANGVVEPMPREPVVGRVSVVADVVAGSVPKRMLPTLRKLYEPDDVALARKPIVILLDPVVMLPPAKTPRPIFCEPVLLLKSVLYPRAMF